MFVRRSRVNFFLAKLFETMVLYAIFSIGTCALFAQTSEPKLPTQDPQQAKPQGNGQSSQMGGVNTAGAHPAVLDKEHRPITAGGFVKNGPVIFQDIVQKAGLTTWKHTMATPEKPYIIESNGS